MKHKKNNPNINCKNDICIPNGCVEKICNLQPCGDMSWDNDKCLVNKIECVRNTITYVCRKQQYLESTGVKKIEEPGSKVSLKSAIVSSLNEMKDVTSVLRDIIGQYDDCHPVEYFEIDTGKLNEYTGGDIEPCVRKLIQIEYITRENVHEEKKVCEIKNTCKKRIRKLQGNPCKYPCKKICEKKCEKKCEKICEKKCEIQRCTVPIRCNKMLLFPLFPIRGAYIYPLLEPKCVSCNCNGPCKCSK